MAVILLSTLLRMIAGYLEPVNGDEAYYHLMGQTPQWSYYDHPPLVYHLARLGSFWPGRAGALTLRWPFILLFSGSIWLMFLLTKKLFGAWPAFYACLWLNLAGNFITLPGLWVAPDGLLIFFWLSCSICLARIFFTPLLNHPCLWWLGAGAALGLALLSKYQAGFLVLGATLFVVSSPSQRKWLVHPGPYLALGVAALFFTPVILWNANNDWISFNYQLGRMIKFPTPRVGLVIQDILGQAVSNLPWVWLPLVVALLGGLARGNKDGPSWFCALESVSLIIFFMSVSSYSGCLTHFHWYLPGYLALFPLLGRTTFAALAKGSRLARRWVLVSAGLTLAVFGLVVSNAATGWAVPAAERLFSLDFPRLPRWSQFASAGRQFFHDQWRLLANPEDVEGFLNRNGLFPQGNLFLFSDHFQVCGQIAWGVRNKWPVLCLPPQSGHGLWTQPRGLGWLSADAVGFIRSDQIEARLPELRTYFAHQRALGKVRTKLGSRVIETFEVIHFQEMIRRYPLRH